MFGKIIAGTVTAFSLLAAGTSFALASDVADIVDRRARAMKAMDRNLRDISAGLGGAAPFVLADVQAKSEEIRKEVAAIPSRFPDGSMNDTSGALPAVWDRKREFADAVKLALHRADGLVVAAQAGDRDRILKSLRQLNQACSSCHTTFRQK